MIRLPALPLTNEHGSWAVFAVPLIVGLAAAERLMWDHAVLILTASAAFLSYVPAQILLGRHKGRRIEPSVAASAAWWMRVLAGVAFAGTIWMVIGGAWSPLIWGGLGLLSFCVHAWLTDRHGKTVWGDLAASIGLSAGAPAALMLDDVTGWSHAAILWLLVSLFFGCSVVYVHMKIRAVAQRFSETSWRSRLRFGWVTLAYHVAVIALVAAIVAGGRTNHLAILAFVPMGVHAVIGTVRRAGPVKFKRLGFLLLGHSVVFAIVLAFAWRGGA